MSYKVLLLRLAPPVYKKNSHPIGFRPPYLLKYVEALLKQTQECEAKCIDQRITALTDKDIWNVVETWKPQAVVFDVSTLNAEITNAFCCQIKSIFSPVKVITFATGQHVSADLVRFKNQYTQYDFVFGGEAEVDVFRLINKLKNDNNAESIKNLFIAKESEVKNSIVSKEDMDSLPFISFDEHEMRGYSFVYPLKLTRKLTWGHLITARGCPYPCAFCTQLMREGYGAKVRTREVKGVVDEMQNLLNFGATIISFDDENFTASRKHVQDVCNEIIRRKLKVPWIAHARVDELDEGILKLMSQAGCVLIRCGMETGNKRILKLLKKTFNREDEWFKKSFDAVKYAHKYKISVACLFMVGTPTETYEEMLESIEFAKKLRPDIIQVSYFTPFPGTAIYDMYKDELEALDIKEFYHYAIPKINVSQMSEEQLKKAQGMFYRKFLLQPRFIISHFLNHFFFYLYNANIFFRLLKTGTVIKPVR